mgnify:CR=1 FL=1
MPPFNTDYRAGTLSWTDWKPITGENAWAFFIGPLQAASLHYQKEGANGFIPLHEPALDNALKVLPTFAQMQSALGGPGFGIDVRCGFSEVAMTLPSRWARTPFELPVPKSMPITRPRPQAAIRALKTVRERMPVF